VARKVVPLRPVAEPRDITTAGLIALLVVCGLSAALGFSLGLFMAPIFR
jgi:hypothetical protein